jgi:predicted nucleic-acid-binding protein
MNTMISIDTNVIVRLLVIDDIQQSNRAKVVFETEQIFVALSVLLETEWVLRVRYDFKKRALTEAIHRLLLLPNVVAEDGPRVMKALNWANAGMDFADALHLAASAQASVFVSFDKKLARISARAGAPLVREP